MVSLKVLWVSNYRIEEGRGPVIRLVNLMESMAELCELSLCSFGEMECEIKSLAQDLKVPIYEVPYKNRGWFVDNAGEISDSILNIAKRKSIDIVILTWEIWDIAVELYKKFKDQPIVFAMVAHSIPFAGLPLKAKGFFRDTFKRALSTNNAMIRKYLFLKSITSKKVLRNMNLITTTPTVEHRLIKYLKKPHLYTVYPGYAVVDRFMENNLDNYDYGYEYDLAFMARFEEGKGLFHLIDIIGFIAEKNKHIKIAMIGTFTFQSDEQKFLKCIKARGLTDNFIFLGWCNEKKKKSILMHSKLFVYPSYNGDTFSISMLEALSLGKKVVCYEAPFISCNYPSNLDVFRVETFNDKKVAEICIDLLAQKDFISNTNYIFVKNNYGNWNNVAKAELACYKDIIRSEKRC